MNRNKFRKIQLFMIVLAAFGLQAAVYDETTGYVRLTADEYNSAGNNRYSLTNSVLWSDGRIPHSDTNYYAAGIGIFGGVTFQGGSLTIGLMRQYNHTAWTTPLVIDDLRVVNNSQLASFGSEYPFDLDGKITVLASASNPFTIIGGKVKNSSTSGSFNIKAKLIGLADTAIRIKASASAAADEGNPLYATYVAFIGDTSEYYGSVEVGIDNKLVFGNCGLPNASVKLTDLYSQIGFASDYDAVVPVARLETTKPVTLQVPVAKKLSVGTLVLVDGVTFDCSNFGTAPAANTAFEVTNLLQLGGRVNVSFGSLTTLAKREMKILSVPSSMDLDADDFAITAGLDENHQLYVKDGGAVKTLCVGVRGGQLLPELPASFNASTGYVYQNNNDSSGDGSYWNAANWSDGEAPHSTTNYYTEYNFRGDSGGTKDGHFAGARLVSRKYFRLSSRHWQIDDWWLVPRNGDYRLDACNLVTTEGGSGYTVWFAGKATFFTTEARPFCFYGGLDGQTYEVNMKLVGAADAGVACTGPLSRAPTDARGKTHCKFLGDTGDYYGTVIVATNSTMWMGNCGFSNAIVKATTRCATLTTEAEAGRRVVVKGLKAPDGVSVTVPATNTLAFGKLVAGCTLVKTGAGTLAFGGEAEVASGTAIDVQEGALEVDSKDALKGVDVTFAAGTVLKVKHDSTDVGFSEKGLVGYNSLALPASLPVMVAADNDLENAETAFLTCSAAEAEGFSGRFVARKSFPHTRVRIGSRVNSDTTVTFFVDTKPNGIIVNFR